MSTDRTSDSPEVEDALSELKETILRLYPDASFEVTTSPDDPDAILLVTTLDLIDTDELMDRIIDRIMEIQIEDGLPIFVVPVRPYKRVRPEQAASRKHRDPGGEHVSARARSISSE